MSEHAVVSNNPNWASPVIFSNSGSARLFAWSFAIVWNAMVCGTGYFAWGKILKAVNEDPLFYIFATFPLIGLFILFKAVKLSLAFKRFGKAPAVMEPFPGQLGGLVAGHVDINLRYEQPKSVIVSLTCMRHYWHKSGNKNTLRRDAIWQDSITVESEPGIGGTRIRFKFTPSENLPESQPDGSDSYHWVLHVKMAMDGHDFDRTYDIPVVKVSERAKASVTRYSRKEIKQVDIDELINESGLPIITPLGEGYVFYFPYFRNMGIGISFLFFGLIFGGFTVFMYGEFTKSMPMVSSIFFGLFALIAIVMIVGSLYTLLNSLSVYVDSTGVKVTYKVAGFRYSRFIEVSKIADILIKRNSSVQSREATRVWYGLKLIQKDGKKNSLGDSLEGRSYAEGVRIKILQSLNEGWSSQAHQTSEKLKPSKRTSKALKVAGFLSSFIIPAAFLYDLKDTFF